MTLIPPSVVRQVIDEGLGEVTRRVELYENGGEVLWRSDVSSRLIEGGINATYGDNERRTLDVMLRNDDNALRSQPGGLWYDKIVKIYRGVQYNPNLVSPRVVILEATGGETGAFILAGKIARSGIENVTVMLDAVSAASLKQYDVFVSYTTSTASAKGGLLKELYAAGKSVITVSTANTGAVIPYVTATVNVSETLGISQPVKASPLSPGWTTEAQGAASGAVPTALDGSATIASRWQRGDSSYVITGSIASNANGGKWFDLHLPSINGANTLRLFANGINWIRGIGSTQHWETQLGEFVIDGINGDLFPSAVKVTGRDYTKRCMNSKIEQAVTFAADTTVGTLVTALAANSGIKKFRLLNMPETLGSTQSFDRGTPRWDIMKKAADANGYEIFFDREGYLVTRKYLDPTTSAPSETWKTGVDGNLAALGRSVNDSRIYNHIAVYGDPSSGETRLPFLAEAFNTNPSSPTNIDELGDRYYSYASTFFTSQQQCQEYANRLLGLHALESFELNISAINYPWVEVGDIGRVIDPNAVATDPDTYLIDSLSIPLSLGPMSLTGKRVTMVG